MNPVTASLYVNSNQRPIVHATRRRGNLRSRLQDAADKMTVEILLSTLHLAFPKSNNRR
jgi:hypothetical protein